MGCETITCLYRSTTVRPVTGERLLEPEKGLGADSRHFYVCWTTFLRMPTTSRVASG